VSIQRRPALSLLRRNKEICNNSRKPPGGAVVGFLLRRDILSLLCTMTLWPAPLRAEAVPVLRLGILEFGTVGWEVETIRRLGLDRQAGVELQVQRLASSDAARIAFLGGSVDVIVSDLLWAARLRAEGRAVSFLPFSATEGAVMVSADSALRTVGDLAGRSIGVAGGALDKSWLLLRAHGLRHLGIDLATAAKPVFGAPPLLTETLRRGGLDAGLLYWTFCARLEAQGYRRLIGVEEIAAGLGTGGRIAFVGHVFSPAAPAAAVAGFARASAAAKQVLAQDDGAWQALRPLMQADDEATFEALRRRFVEGIPTRSVAAEMADAARLYAVLAELGGEALVGPARELPAGLYWQAPA